MTTAIVLRLALKTFGILAVLYGMVVGSLFLLMRGPNRVAGKALALLPGPAFMVLPLESMWITARKGSLEVGQEAPDFDLAALEGGGRVRLSTLRHAKPVVLVFGSFSCPPFRREAAAVNKVYESYRDRADFYFVYIEEAHATDVWPLRSNEKDKVLYATAKDHDERASVARTCSKELKMAMPILIDDMTNGADEAYRAWPTRMYVVDRDGKVAFKGLPGPFGFDAAALEKALARIVSAAPLAQGE